MSRVRTYACPCCGFLTLSEPPPGTFDICPVCRWEDDNIQYDDVNYRGGANRVSLRQAQENFRAYGKSDLRRPGEIRPPLPEERLRHPRLGETEAAFEVDALKVRRREGAAQSPGCLVLPSAIASKPAA